MKFDGCFVLPQIEMKQRYIGVPRWLELEMIGLPGGRRLQFEKETQIPQFRWRDGYTNSNAQRAGCFGSNPEIDAIAASAPKRSQAPRELNLIRVRP